MGDTARAINRIIDNTARRTRRGGTLDRLRRDMRERYRST